MGPASHPAAGQFSDLKGAANAVGPNASIDSGREIRHLQMFNQAKAAHKRAKTRDLLTETGLKRIYAQRSFWMLAAQLIAMNAVFFYVGLAWLRFSDYVLHLYMAGALAECFGVILVITRYLFSKH